MSTPTVTRTNTRTLSCCVCGTSTRGRQWWNRDTGYGICDRCAENQAKREAPEVMTSLYGVAGVHYAIKEAP